MSGFNAEGIIISEVLKMIEWFMQFRCGWVIWVIIWIAAMMLIMAFFKGAKIASEGGEGWKVKPVGNKRKCSAASSATSDLSANGTMESDRSSKTGKHSRLLTTPADIAKSRHLENVQFMKMRQVRRAGRKKNEPGNTA